MPVCNHSKTQVDILPDFSTSYIQNFSYSNRWVLILVFHHPSSPTKSIFDQPHFSLSWQKQLCFCHFRWSFHKITGVCAKDALFLLFEAATPQSGTYSWILCEDGCIPCCLDPKAILLVLSFWKSFSQSPFIDPSPLLLFQATPMILPNKKEHFKQTDKCKQHTTNHTYFIESNNSSDIVVILYFLFSYTDNECAITLP